MQKNSFIKFVSIIFLLLIIVVNLSKNNDDSEAIIPIDYSSPTCLEFQSFFKDTLETQRSWLDYAYHDNCLTYATSIDDYINRKAHRKAILDNPFLSNAKYWREIYMNLAHHDFEALIPLADSLSTLANELQLTRDGFAELIVSFVQDIPYSFILPGYTCSNEDPNIDCVEGERYGLLGPVEFLHTLSGDCDTRTVLLYTLLKHFDFHPVIVNSWKYLHSMLLLDVKSSGEHLTHKGQRLYFWETTATGWRSGEIPPDMTDLNSWEIILD